MTTRVSRVQRNEHRTIKTHSAKERRQTIFIVARDIIDAELSKYDVGRKTINRIAINCAGQIADRIVEENTNA